MRKANARVIGLLAGLAIGSCGTIPLKESQIDTIVSTRVDPIVVGKTDRAEVHRLLGSSRVSSEYWNFDLFRLTDSSSEIFLMMFVPIPAGGYTETGYVLVTYGADGRVSALDREVAHGLLSSCQPSLQLETGPVGFVELGRVRMRPVGVTVEAGGFGEYVSVAGAARDDFLQSVSDGDQCLVLMGIQSGWQSTDSLSIDGGTKQLLPASVVVASRTGQEPGDCPVEVRNWLVPLFFSPGTHSIDTFSGAKPFASASFECAAGDILYARIDQPIEITQQVPAELIGQPLLVHASGVWLVPQEPGARSIVEPKQ